MRALFVFYKCEDVTCNAIYAVETDKVDEPICPACGHYYFSYLNDVEVEIPKITEGDQCAKV